MSQSLTQIYDARVTAGTLHADAAQRAVLPMLERVRAGLEAPVKKPLFGFLAKPAPAHGGRPGYQAKSACSALPHCADSYYLRSIKCLH